MCARLTSSSICFLAVLSACGGEVGRDAAEGGGAGFSGSGAMGGVALPRGGAGGAGGSGAGGATTTQGGRASVAGAPSGGSPFIDPGCPNVEPPPPINECDPLRPFEGCPLGAGCYPYVEHPFGEGCGAESYGAICARAGSGVQGDPCGSATEGCMPGYLCVVGAHAGARCAKLCMFKGPDECPLGMVCGDTDVQGYGVCN